MSDMRDLLSKLAVLESQEPEQKKVNQLSADFKPKTTAVLTAKKDPKNPMGGKMVGACEDVLSTVKRGLTDYLRGIEDREALAAKDILPKNLDTHDIGAKVDAGPVLVAKVQKAPVKVIKIDDVNECGIWGDEEEGFEIRRGDKVLPTRFDKLDHAVAAVDAWQGMRQKPEEDGGEDYAEEM